MIKGLVILVVHETAMMRKEGARWIRRSNGHVTVLSVV